MKKAVILLSGGLDSATVAAMALLEEYELFALTFDYGQNNKEELQASEKIVNALKIPSHLIIPLPFMRIFGGSALTNDKIPIAKNSTSKEIPATYVPARNIIFMSIALSYAETIGAEIIYSGINAVDYSGYPDCRPEYVDAFNVMAFVGTKTGVTGKPIRIEAPLINMTKVDIIRAGIALGVDYDMTHSCYSPVEGKACGECDSCQDRRFALANI